MAETCSYCRRKRETRPISRYGGGTYRRGGRSYSGRICEQDAVTLAVLGWGQSSSSRYSVASLRRVIESFTGWSRERTEAFLTDQNRKHHEARRERPWPSAQHDPWPDYVAAKRQDGDR